jgi:hypothetical protein
MNSSGQYPYVVGQEALLAVKEQDRERRGLHPLSSHKAQDRRGYQQVSAAAASRLVECALAVLIERLKGA